MSKNFKRCFAFGCSFTKYMWPTTADFVGLYFDEFYNFGLAGSCNSYIMYKLYEIDKIYNFNKETDVILIGTTGIARHSFLTNNLDYEGINSWKTSGDIIPINSHHEKDIKTFSNTLFNLNHAIYSSYMAINYMKVFLENKEIKFFVYPAVNSDFYLDLAKELDISNRSKNLYSDWKLSHDIGESIDSFFMTDDRIIIFETGEKDSHPPIIAYYKYTEKYFPEFVNDKTRQVCLEQINNFKITSKKDQNEEFFHSFTIKYRSNHN
jgi:hypothetical protein